MQNPQQIEARVEERHKVLLILWFALLISITAFFVMTLFVPGRSAEPNALFSYALAGAAFMAVVASVLFKQQFVKRATEKRDVPTLQSGYLIGFCLSESAALFGLLDHFVTGSKYYYFSFALSLLGMLLHFPKKDHVRAAIG